LSFDENHLYSAGEDGTLFILEIKSKEIRTRKVNEGQIYADLDQVLIHRGLLDTRDDLISKLRAQISEISSQNEFQVKVLEKNHQEV
jgi:hypothetical protein